MRESIRRTMMPPQWWQWARPLNSLMSSSANLPVGVGTVFLLVGHLENPFLL